MGGRWALALGAMAVATVAGAAVPAGPPGAPEGAGGGGAGRGGGAGDVCELRGADRARTPSHRCMSCHDGSAGGTIGFSTRADGHGNGHPVTVDYDDAAARNPGRYRARGMLPRSVTLVNGKVECTSCHDGASNAPRRVAEQRELCKACHQM